MAHLAVSALQHLQFWMDSFQIWHKWSLACQIYFVECVSKIKHILSVIHYTICEVVCFQLTHFPCDDENIYTLSYYHHKIGSMNYYPLFRVRSWNNWARCMSFYILMRGCVMHNNLWARPISSRSFSHDFVIKHSLSCLLYSVYSSGWILSQCGTNDHWQKRVCHAMTLDFDLYLQGYLAVTLSISWIIFIYDTKPTHEGTMHHISFFSQRSWSQRSLELCGLGEGILEGHWSTISSCTCFAA